MSYRARPVMIVLHVNDPKKAADFYTDMLGVKFARSLSKDYVSYHAPISSDGILLQLAKNSDHHKNLAVVYFAVKDLDKAVAEATAGGGKVLVEPFDIKVAAEVYEDYRHAYEGEFTERKPSESLGRGCQVRTANGEAIGLMQLHPHAEVFYTRHEPGATVWSSHQHLARHSRAIAMADKFERRMR